MAQPLSFSSTLGENMTIVWSTPTPTPTIYMWSVRPSALPIRVTFWDCFMFLLGKRPNI